MDGKYLEFAVPPFAREGIESLLRHIVTDCVKRGARRALARLPKDIDAAPLSATECKSIAARLADAVGSGTFRLALLVPEPRLYELFMQIAQAAEESGMKAMAFVLQEDAVRWLMF